MKYKGDCMFEPSFRVERSITITAPSEKIAAFLFDFHKWEAWSPFEALDPTMKKNFAGPVKGKGSIYEWDGSGKVGAGRMEIKKVTPTRIVIDLSFMRPMQSVSPTTFSLKQQGKETKVTWTMTGKHNFMSKIMCLFVSMDNMIGKDFEKGLANLKQVVEKKA